MIFAEIKGRLGNQFFRYAFSRKLQEERGNKDSLVFSFNNMLGKDSNDGWEDSLRFFNVNDYNVYKKKGRLVFNETTFAQKLVAILYYIDIRILGKNKRTERIKRSEKWEPLLNKSGVILLGEKYYDFFTPKQKNIIIDGGFQCSKYFNSIRSTLLEQFTPREAPLEHNKDLYAVINSTNSVCVTIRRGDYVTVEKFKKIYDICNVNYFIKATEIMKEKVKNPVFIVFSDDINWVRENIEFGVDTYYETGTDPIWEKIRLMYSCKHFIISNSSFSWWAQYLGRCPDKIVISPERWYNGDYPCYLIEDSFIKIHV